MQSHKSESRFGEGLYAYLKTSTSQKSTFSYLTLRKLLWVYASPVPTSYLIYPLKMHLYHQKKSWAVASSVLLSESLEQLLEVGRSGIEGLVKIPEGKERSETKDPKELHIWFSLINSETRLCQSL